MRFGQEARLRPDFTESPRTFPTFGPHRARATARTGAEAKARPPAEPATVCLPYQPQSVRAARHFVTAKLLEWRLDELVDDATLIVSELVTNAAKTGCQTRMIVAVRRPSARILRILVGDGSRSMPVMIQAGRDATSGRGLAMVHRLTRGRWGVTPLPHGKIVHADLSITDSSSAR
ncbi:ATP-binding protein [Streptomyces sp. NRRL WC-3742]|uniref:ATP-binding protein n=1 Tax=Streptomyces sp. NRRL WC-3742 TaxID=1463934 RepID=UPI00068ED40C|nr:ATP-binding protein [Streptomyces sp. NRRL WC-3742]